jgi:hypothetical protein
MLVILTMVTCALVCGGGYGKLPHLGVVFLVE